ncbi:MAG TPA: T9SS type A sorting domain-containing protein, partial [Flavipsychrobacter sp.]|nr:T9SS type A sorting domain-containing protein [Flavipsychrobacter sp.]
SCGNVCSLDPIGGPSSLCIGDVSDTFTNTAPGGTWSSSNRAAVAINPSTGVVGGIPISTPSGTVVTITYTVNGCIVTKKVTLVNCQPGGRMMQVIANDTAAANDMVDIYPNPAHNNITISYASHSSQLLKISIKDINGGVVHAESVMCNSGNSRRHSVDISSFAPGIYFVELTFGDQHVVKKIIKE